MAKLLYQGHGSFRLTSSDGVVVFIDPFVGEGYDMPADIVLISHQHPDHNQIDLITQKPNCTIISNVEALEGGKHNTFNLKGIEIEAVEAANEGHPIDQCVGFIITMDGLQMYFSCDTSRTAQMEEFAARNLDFAFLCADGHYNMDLAEAAECAEIIGAKHNVPVHLKPGELFDREMAEQFTGPNRVIIEAGEEVELNS
ncbi:MAG: MBL fold metallo-hydrolase [Coriobacteriia bacterium]|nr:MBL fold metallo-hydrolase [Coriobacteriia bacterium]MCL2749447.1 MBL fold metallo-hydrolase [Coriobacteriia bacterium]